MTKTKKEAEHWKDYVFGFIEINENGDQYLIAMHKTNDARHKCYES